MGVSAADAFDSVRPAKTTTANDCNVDGPEEIILFLPKAGWGMKRLVLQDDCTDGIQYRLSYRCHFSRESPG